MKILILLMLAALCLPVFAGTRNVLVYEFDATGMEPTEAAQVSNFMRQRLAANPEIQILQPPSFEYSIFEVTMDPAQAIQLAQPFEADYAIVASLGKIGDLFTIDVKLLSVPTGESFEKDGSYEGSLELFVLHTVSNLTDEMIDHMIPPEQPSPAAPPTPEVTSGKSWYKKWWLWAGIGGAAVIGGVLAQGGSDNPENPDPTDQYLPEPPVLP